MLMAHENLSKQWHSSWFGPVWHFAAPTGVFQAGVS